MLPSWHRISAGQADHRSWGEDMSGVSAQRSIHTRRPSRLRRMALVANVAGVLAWCMAGFSPSMVLGHNPTMGVAHYPQYFEERYDWGTGATDAWLQSAFTTAAGTYWNSGNNSAAPSWSLDTQLNTNFIQYQGRVASGCGAGVVWYACVAFDGLGRLDRIVFSSTTSEVKWCESTSPPPAGCFYLKTYALHELGHAAGLARSEDGYNHSSEPKPNTVMMAPRLQAGTPGHSGRVTSSSSSVDSTPQSPGVPTARAAITSREPARPASGS